MKKLSVVIPVFNAKLSLVQTLISISENTDNLYELVIVDDYSDEDTQKFIASIGTNGNFRVTKTRNPSHSWTNASWNIGVKLATGDYIAVLNSDIVLSPHWDTNLISMLDKKHCTIVCPLEQIGSKQITLDPLIEKVDPHMIKGACFMFRRQETRKLFPIPEELTHWCGDNYLADRANEQNGVTFCAGATITHAITQSGRLIDRKLYNETVYNDVIRYQNLSGRNMTLVLEQITPS